MPNDKEMYCTLFRAQAKAMAILEGAQKKTEALFIDSEDSVVLIDFKAHNRDNKSKTKSVKRD